MLLDIPMYIMNTQNVHTCTHSHRILVYFVFFFSVLTFSSPCSFHYCKQTIVQKWHTHMYTRMHTVFSFPLFLKTYVHTPMHNNAFHFLHFPLLSLRLPLFTLLTRHAGTLRRDGREGNGSSPWESSTRRAAQQRGHKCLKKRTMRKDGRGRNITTVAHFPRPSRDAARGEKGAKWVGCRGGQGSSVY